MPEAGVVSPEPAVGSVLFPITLFRGRLIPEGTQLSESWERLVQRFSRHFIRAEKDGPGWSPTRYREDAVYRDAQNVETLTLLVQDIDDGTPLDALREAIGGFEWLAYTTHSHTAAHPKYRIVYPLLSEVPKALWAAVWSGAAAWLIGEHIDPSCRNISRFYYLPSCPAEREPEKWVVRNHGRTLDAAELAAHAPPEPSPSSRRATGAPVSGEGDYKTLDAVAWFRHHGAYGRDMGGGKHAVVCLWVGEHTQPSKPQDSDTVIWEGGGGRWPSFFCTHAHCVGRGIREVLEYWGDADTFCSAEFQRAPKFEPPPVHGDEDAPPFSRNGAAANGRAPMADTVARPAGGPPLWATARELLAKELSPLEWVVPGVIPEGLTLLGGRPKQGKSWGVYGIGLAVAAGGMAFGKIAVTRGDVLYLALEDGERRLQARMRSLLQGEPAPSGFDWAINWPKLARPGQFPTAERPDCLLQIQWWLDEHPEARLVVIDTLARIRPKAPKGGNAYDDDTDAMAPLHRIALERRIGLLLITHTRKPPKMGDKSDFLDEIQGSTGITGVADTILGLKKTGDQEVSLFCRGRDVDEQELLIEWDADTCDWRLLGNADRLRLTEIQAEVLSVLQAAGAPLHYRVVARSIGKTGNVAEKGIGVVLSRLADKDLVKRAGEGFYSYE